MQTCFGFGHYANECTNMLRKYGKNISVSWSDEENNQEEEIEKIEDQTLLFAITNEVSLLEAGDEVAGEVVSTLPGYDVSDYSNLFCFNVTLDDESDNEVECDMDPHQVVVELKKMFDELHIKYKKSLKVVKVLKKENTYLKESVSWFEVMLTKKDTELSNVKSQLELGTEMFKKLNTCTSKLDNVLSLHNVDTLGLGFNKTLGTVFPKVVSTNGKPFVKEGELDQIGKYVDLPKKPQRKRKYIC